MRIPFERKSKRKREKRKANTKFLHFHTAFLFAILITIQNLNTPSVVLERWPTTCTCSIHLQNDNWSKLSDYRTLTYIQKQPLKNHYGKQECYKSYTASFIRETQQDTAELKINSILECAPSSDPERFCRATCSEIASMNRERRRLECGPSQEPLHEDITWIGLNLSMAGAFRECDWGTHIVPDRSANCLAWNSIAKGRATALGPRRTEFHTIAIAYQGQIEGRWTSINWERAPVFYLDFVCRLKFEFGDTLTRGLQMLARFIELIDWAGSYSARHCEAFALALWILESKQTAFAQCERGAWYWPGLGAALFF